MNINACKILLQFFIHHVIIVFSFDINLQTSSGSSLSFNDIFQALKSSSGIGGTLKIGLLKGDATVLNIKSDVYEFKYPLLVIADDVYRPSLVLTGCQFKISAGVSLQFDGLDLVFQYDEIANLGSSFFYLTNADMLRFKNCSLKGNFQNRALVQGALNSFYMENTSIAFINCSSENQLTLIEVTCNDFQFLILNVSDTRFVNSTFLAISLKYGSSVVNNLKELKFRNISLVGSKSPLISVLGTGVGELQIKVANFSDVKTNYLYLISFQNWNKISLETVSFENILSADSLILGQTINQFKLLKALLNSAEGSFLTLKTVNNALVESLTLRKCISYLKACFVVYNEIESSAEGSLSVLNSLFEVNKVSLPLDSLSPLQAGAVYIRFNSIVTIAFSNFSENELSNTIIRPSGASLTYDSRIGIIIISNCIFKKNKSLYHTSGMLIVSVSCSIISADFLENEPLTKLLNQTHDSNTGPINFDSFSFNLINATFYKNKGYSGSMIFFFTEAFKETRVYNIENVTSSENLCYQGGFFFDASIGDLFITINIKTSDFIKNFAEGFGSAMRTSFNSIYVKIYYVRCRFLNNTSVKFGGAIALKTTSGTVHWSYSEFNNNTALNGKGGAIFGSCLSYTLIQTYKCLFVNNRALMARHIYIIIGNYSDQYSTYATGFSSVQSQFAFGSRGYFEYSTFINVNSSSTGTFFQVLQGSDVRILHCKFENITTTNNIISGIMFGSLRIDNTSMRMLDIEVGHIFFLTKIRFLDIKNLKMSHIIVREGVFMIAATNLNPATLTNISIINITGPFLSCQDSSILLVTNVSITDLKSDSMLLGTLLDMRSSSTLNISLFRTKNIIGGAREMIKIADSNLLLKYSSILNFRTDNIDLMSGTYSIVKLLFCEFTNFTDHLMVLSNVDLSIENVTFVGSGDTSNIKAASVGGIYAQDNPNTVITNSSFSNFTSNNGAVLNLIGLKSISILNIKSSVFKRNFASNQGGVMKLINIDAIINCTEFMENYAATGGAIWNSCSLKSTTCSLKIQDSRFTNNKARDQGGVIFWFDKEPVINNKTIFQANMAFYGNDNASFPVRMRPYNRTTNEPEPVDSPLQEEVSGSLISKKLHLRLIDPYGQEANLVDNPFIRGFAFVQIYEDQRGSSKLAKLKASNINRSALIGDLQVPVVKGEINFEYLKLVGDPDSYVSLKIDIDLNYNPTYLKELREDEIIEDNKYYLFVDVYLRNCIRGEVYNFITNTCDKCPADTFSLTVPGTVCEHCPERGTCPGGDIIKLESQGLWRANFSSKIYECRLQKNQCLGGVDSLCAEGYAGILCDSCTHGFRLSNFQCRDCSEWGIGIVILIGFFLFYTIIIALNVRKKSSFDNSKDNPMFKIFITYIQTIALVKFFEMDIGLGSLSKALKGISNSIFGSFQYPGLMFDIGFSISGIDCIFTYSPVASYENYFYKVLFSDFVPVFFCVGSVIVLCLSSQRRIYKNRRFGYFKQNLIVTFVIIFFLFQPSIVQNGLQIMNCSRIDNTLYLDMNYEIECWTGPHLFWAVTTVFPFLVLATIIIPAFLFFLLKNVLNPDVDIQELTKSRYGFILSGYRDDKFFWELFIMIRKFFLQTSVILLYNLNMKLCLFITFLLLLLFIYLQMRFKPFLWEDINLLELKGLFAITMLTFVYFYSQFKNTGLEVIIFMAAAVLLNVIYCYGFLKYFIVYLIERYKAFKSTVKKVSLNIKVRSSEYLSRLSITKKLAAEMKKKPLAISKKKKTMATSARTSKDAFDDNSQAKPHSFSSRLSSYEKMTRDVIEKENIFIRKDSKKQSQSNNSPEAKKEGQKLVIGRDNLCSRNSSNNITSYDSKNNIVSRSDMVSMYHEAQPHMENFEPHGVYLEKEKAERLYSHKQNPNVKTNKKQGDVSVGEIEIE